MQQSSEFIASKAGEKISTVRLKVRDLFSDGQNHAYGQIIERANELGLDLLPHETASGLLLKEETQPKLGEWFTVMSRPMAPPRVFNLGRYGGGLSLGSRWAGPTNKWNPDNGLLFRLRQVSSES